MKWYERLWEENLNIVLIVFVILMLIVSLYFMRSMNQINNYHMEAVADCVAYNFNHTNSSCWV